MSCTYCFVNEATHHCGGPCGKQTLYCSQICGDLHYTESHAQECQFIAGRGDKRPLLEIIEDVEVEHYLKQLIIAAQEQSKTLLKFDTRLAMEKVSEYTKTPLDEIRTQITAYFEKMPKETKSEWLKNLRAPFVNVQKEIMDTYLRIVLRNIQERRLETDESSSSIYAQIATVLEIMGNDISKTMIANYFQILATSTDPYYALAQQYFKSVRVRIEKEKLQIFNEDRLNAEKEAAKIAQAKAQRDARKNETEKFTTGEMFDMVMEHFITRWKAGKFDNDEIEFYNVAEQFRQSLKKQIDVNLLKKSWINGPDSFESAILRFIKEKKPQYKAAYDLLNN